MTSREMGAVMRHARHILTERGEVADGLVNALVARSWRRCVDEGIAPVGRLEQAPYLSAAELARNAERNHELISIAQPVLEYVFSQTRGSGSMVILADKEGTLVQSLGDSNFLSRADRVALSAGTSWQESYRGTNAIGTALVEATPLVVHAGEHYLERNKFLTCAAAPIAAPDGQIMGVIDISGEQRSRHPHTFGLVRAAAQMIENRLFDVRHGNSLKLRFHPLVEGISTVAEGVIALSDDGWIVGANQAAMQLLNLIPVNLGVNSFARVFGLSFEDLLEWAQKRPGEPLLIEQGKLSAKNARLFVRIEMSNRPVPVTRSQAKTVVAHDALSALDTGDESFHAAIERMRRVLNKPIPILLQGESGVGKEWLAKAGHESGPRRNRPFVAVNCAALPESLIEAELFGYEAGAFTGARKEGMPGKIREAHGGTLFLDEIGDMPLALQGRLLRVLQERKVMPLGGSKPFEVDFNLVCATHQNLNSEQEAGKFRSDLYYRINGLTLILPPLRARTDFDVIINRLLEQLVPERRVTLSPELRIAFRDYHWPGNLRQLHNALRTACAMQDEDETVITLQHLSEDLARELRKTVRPTTDLPVPAAEQNLTAMSQSMIRQAIQSSAGNMSEAARRLGISRNTLYRHIKVSHSKQKLN